MVDMVTEILFKFAIFLTVYYGMNFSRLMPSCRETAKLEENPRQK